jgi:hypothetical protein
MTTRARRRRWNALATIVGAAVLACHAAAQAPAAPAAKAPKAAPTKAEARKGAGAVCLRVGRRLFQATVVSHGGQTWLVAGISAYSIVMEESDDPLALFGAGVEAKIPRDSFRFAPGIPGAVCAPCGNDLKRKLESAGIAPFADGDWSETLNQGATLVPLRRDAEGKEQKGDPVGGNKKDAADQGTMPIDPRCTTDEEGAPFVPRDEPGKIVGIGVRSKSANDTPKPVGELLCRQAVFTLLERAEPIDPEVLLASVLAGWADADGLGRIETLLEKHCRGQLLRWWIVNLDGSGLWRGKYRTSPPEGGSRLLVAIPESKKDQLDLRLDKPENKGVGEDREPYREAIVRIGVPSDADGADLIVWSASDDPAKMRPSSSRVLFLEVGCDTPGAKGVRLRRTQEP